MTIKAVRDALWKELRSPSALGLATFFATYSAPLGASEQQTIDIRNEDEGL